MALIQLSCPNCNGDIHLDDKNEFGYCMYCGTKVQIAQRIKLEHSGTISVNGIASVENLVEKGYLNMATADFEQAKNAFQNVLAIDACNMYALIGMMCISATMKDSRSVQIYYQRVKDYSPTYSKEESRFLGANTCHFFATAYALVQDCDRLGYVLSKYSECDEHLRNDFRTLNRSQITLLLKHISPDRIFWGAQHRLTTDALVQLVSHGLDVNAPLDVDKGYPCPLAIALESHQIEWIPVLLEHGANPNGSMRVLVEYEDKPNRYEVKKYLDAAYHVNLPYDMRRKVRKMLKQYGAKNGLLGLW